MELSKLNLKGVRQMSEYSAGAPHALARREIIEHELAGVPFQFKLI